MHRRSPLLILLLIVAMIYCSLIIAGAIKILLGL
jgi:hypothetical protein